MIYGYGISGKSIETYLINKKCKYNIYDDLKVINNSKFIDRYYLSNHLNEYDYFVVSPSIKIDKNHFLFRHKEKILIDLDFLSLELTNQQIIGVTGTEGKSSTCNYLKGILSNKYNTKIIGNFGDTILDNKNLIKYLSKIDILIVELSSYQLDKLKFLKINYAIITNIFCDHLDYHDNVRNYIKSKFKIQYLLHKNSNLHLSKELYVNFSKNIKINKNRIIINDYKNKVTNDLTKYFRELNLQTIKKLVYEIDSQLDIKIQTNTKELIYRNQLIHNSKNLKIYNDSKCTNLNNSIYKNNLINSKKKILILGGKFKKVDKNSHFNVSNTLVLLFGDHANLFIKHLNFINSKVYKFKTLTELCNFLKIAIKVNLFNYILFSPGGESFDFYKNYIDRGNHFNQLLKKIKI